MIRTRLARSVAIAAILAAVPAYAQPENARFLRLTESSSLLHEFCLPPCACPTSGQVAPLRGGLVLIPEIIQPPAYARYRAVQIHWSSESPRGLDALSGTGTFEEFGDFVLQQRLQLDLALDSQPDAPPQLFDTGSVFGSDSLAASADQFGCQQLTLSVRWVERCRADFNADGLTNPDDLGDFINAYFALPPDPRSDFNLDNTIDPDDLGDFINAFFGDPCA